MKRRFPDEALSPHGLRLMSGLVLTLWWIDCTTFLKALGNVNQTREHALPVTTSSASAALPRETPIHDVRVYGKLLSRQRRPDHAGVDPAILMCLRTQL